MVDDAIAVERCHDYWRGTFTAMASPCEILLEAHDETRAREVCLLAAREAWRIEAKFSRYRSGNIVYAINHSGGHPVTVDDETAHLLSFADQCHRLSGGLFDITSGVLRRVWTFDGSERVPDAAQVAALLPNVGWHNVRWRPPVLTLPAGMEIDLGGIGKEYAVDRVLGLIVAQRVAACLVNFGGDLAASGPRADGQAWTVGIEDPDAVDNAKQLLRVSGGALATSGDARRFVRRAGKRYGHILDPRSGWPIEGAPRSVTVAARTCVEAGMLATFAMLHGARAEAFLKEQGVRYWCLRE